jgi:hypothetical protein
VSDRAEERARKEDLRARAAGDIASGLVRLLTMSTDYNQRSHGERELADGISEALLYLKGE